MKVIQWIAITCENNIHWLTVSVVRYICKNDFAKKVWFQNPKLINTKIAIVGSVHYGCLVWWLRLIPTKVNSEEKNVSWLKRCITVTREKRVKLMLGHWRNEEQFLCLWFALRSRWQINLSSCRIHVQINWTADPSKLSSTVDKYEDSCGASPYYTFGWRVLIMTTEKIHYKQIETISQ